MLIPLEQLRRFGVKPGPVLHVGAHTGEEAPAYKRNGFFPVWWVEGNPDLEHILRIRLRQYREHHVVIALLSDRVSEVPFHIASNGESSSMLELGTHLKEHPSVSYVSTKTLKTTTVDLLAKAGEIGRATFMNLDVQGAELLVLKGAREYLEGVQAVYTEVNDQELYVGCPLIEDLDDFLKARGFQFVGKRMTRNHWGDGIWRRP